AAPNAEGHPAAHAGNVLGRGRLMVLGIGGVYGAARIVGNEPLAAGAGRVFAGLAAAGVVNGALKFGVGRLRPHAGEGSLRFRPFNLQNRWQSFPAGHALAAFALAAALSEEAGSPWVTVPAFGAATLVGWSRIYDDKHWTSDVVGGAAIGTLVSRGTVRWLRQRRGTDAPLPIAVVAMPDGIVFYLPLP
ncbi:MAG: phosphatase PAP2 family protein, partial [Gemmatimonadota bacterium]|nr:phosphatase PAP2 family protein [Gemmatimonadota bacterium]